MGGKWIVVTGARDLTEQAGFRVGAALAAAVTERPAGIIFGGARGVDTIALIAAAQARGSQRVPRLVVIVPGRVATQPAVARGAIPLADEVIELGLPMRPTSFFQRNQRMISEAVARAGDTGVIMLAFPAVPFRRRSGTRHAVQLARAHQIEVIARPVDCPDLGLD